MSALIIIIITPFPFITLPTPVSWIHSSTLIITVDMALNASSDKDSVEIALKQMHQAFVLAGSKVEKHPKEETPSEIFHRVREAQEKKKNKKAKSAAKMAVKKKIVKKMTVYFPCK